MLRYEYHAELYKESILGSVIFGDSKVNPERLSDFLNNRARQGWKVISIERETRRTLLFFSREAFIVIFERPLG